MKIVKIAAISVGSLIALLIVLMIAIPYFFKDKIIDAALNAFPCSPTSPISPFRSKTSRSRVPVSSKAPP